MRRRSHFPSCILSSFPLASLVELNIIQPHAKIEFVVDAGIAKRQIASIYPKTLEETGILASRKVGREKISVHAALTKLLREPYHVSKNMMYVDTF